MAPISVKEPTDDADLCIFIAAARDTAAENDEITEIQMAACMKL